MLSFNDMCPEAIAAIRASLGALGASGVVSVPLQRALEGDCPLRGVYPHLFYDLARDDLIAPDGWKQRLVSERCLLVQDTEPLVVAEVLEQTLAVALHEGPQVQSIPATIRRLERELPIDGPSFDVSVARFRADHLLTLLLTAGAEALFVPLAPIPHGLSGQCYTPQRLWAALKGFGPANRGVAPEPFLPSLHKPAE